MAPRLGPFPSFSESIVKELVAPRLKALGFKKVRRTWTATTERSVRTFRYESGRLNGPDGGIIGYSFEVRYPALRSVPESVTSGVYYDPFLWPRHMWEVPDVSDEALLDQVRTDMGTQLDGEWRSLLSGSDDPRWYLESLMAARGWQQASDLAWQVDDPEVERAATDQMVAQLADMRIRGTDSERAWAAGRLIFQTLRVEERLQRRGRALDDERLAVFGTALPLLLGEKGGEAIPSQLKHPVNRDPARRLAARLGIDLDAELDRRVAERARSEA